MPLIALQCHLSTCHWRVSWALLSLLRVIRSCSQIILCNWLAKEYRKKEECLHTSDGGAVKRLFSARCQGRQCTVQWQLMQLQFVVVRGETSFLFPLSASTTGKQIVHLLKKEKKGLPSCRMSCVLRWVGCKAREREVLIPERFKERGQRVPVWRVEEFSVNRIGWASGQSGQRNDLYRRADQNVCLRRHTANASSHSSHRRRESGAPVHQQWKHPLYSHAAKKRQNGGSKSINWRLFTAPQVRFIRKKGKNVEYNKIKDDIS